MIRPFYLIKLVVVVLVFVGMQPMARGAITGIVVDETSAPLKFVNVQIRGFAEFENGKWIRRMRTGTMPVVTTDDQGRFSLDANPLRKYALAFDRYGFGPTFLWGVEDGTSLSVVMNPGVVIRGSVTRRNNEESSAPVAYAPVSLQVPAPDFWYEQQGYTNEDGVYELRASPLDYHVEKKRGWKVKFLDEVVPVEIKMRRGEQQGPVFEVGITVRQLERSVRKRGQDD